MKTFRNIALGILISTFIVIVGCLTFYNYQISPVSKSDKTVSIEIPNGANAKDIASILKKNGLIRDERMFIIYAKLNKSNNMKAGYYDISPNMGVKKIVAMLEEGSKINPNEITLTFREGITMRDIAKVIEDGTNNSYDSVIEKSNDLTYLNSVIEKYWFVTSDILNDDIYYKLEGYLFPETYNFNNKDVTVEEIFNKMLDQMAKMLEPYKDDITKSNLSIHGIMTLASMVEKESPKDIEYKQNEASESRRNVASVFMNRINRGMSLGSDVTAYYALKIDNAKKYVDEVCGGRNCINYNVQSPYNTRLTNGTMNGKLPVGPISTISLASLKAAINPTDTNYIYFIANIQTNETFFYENASGFNAKKNELNSVNGGL